jgi:hypothetical protein
MKVTLSMTKSMAKESMSMVQTIITTAIGHSTKNTARVSTTTLKAYTMANGTKTSNTAKARSN